MCSLCPVPILRPRSHACYGKGWKERCPLHCFQRNQIMGQSNSRSRYSTEAQRWHPRRNISLSLWKEIKTQEFSPWSRFSTVQSLRSAVIPLEEQLLLSVPSPSCYSWGKSWWMGFPSIALQVKAHWKWVLELPRLCLSFITFLEDEMHSSPLELGKKRVELNVCESFKYFTQESLHKYLKKYLLF